MPRVPELGRSRGDAHQEPASSSTGCPEDGPRLRGSAPSPKALWSQGSDSEKRCPDEAALLSCSLKNLNNEDLQKQAQGRACRTLAEPQAEHHRPGLWGSGKVSGFLQRGREQFCAPHRDRGSEPAPCAEAWKPRMRSEAQVTGEKSLACVVL